MIEISWPLLITQVATFLVAMVIVWKLFWKPLTATMQSRTRKIAEDIERAEKGRQEIESLEAEYRRRLSEIEEQARQKINEALHQGMLAKEDILKEARSEAQRILEKSRQDLEAERQQVIRSLRSQVADISMAAVERIVGQSLDPKMQKHLLDDFLDEVAKVEKLQ